MTFKTFLRHVREGFKSVFRNGWMSVASITSIVVSLFVLGVFILLVLNVNAVADEADSQVQINVHLALDTDQKLRETLQTEIGNMPEVSKIVFISKEDGLKELREDMGEDAAELLEGFDVDNSFIMPISLRLARIVTRIVLEMRNIDISPSPATKIKPIFLTARVILNKVSMEPLPYFTL